MTNRRTKDLHIVVRVDDAIRKKLERLALAWSESLSGVIRRLIVDAKVPKADE